jgi:hypothetical protein
MRKTTSCSSVVPCHPSRPSCCCNHGGGGIIPHRHHGRITSKKWATQRSLHLSSHHIPWAQGASHHSLWRCSCPTLCGACSGRCLLCCQEPGPLPLSPLVVPSDHFLYGLCWAVVLPSLLVFALLSKGGDMLNFLAFFLREVLWKVLNFFVTVCCCCSRLCHPCHPLCHSCCCCRHCNLVDCCDCITIHLVKQAIHCLWRIMLHI